MNWMYDRVMSGEVMAGVWLTFGSSTMAEMAGLAGYDWALVDTEHGYAGMEAVIPQLQALDATGCASLVRIASHDPALFKRALDFGPSGIMTPMVNSADEARRVVQAMRYPPEGIRGFTGAGRGPKLGFDLDTYLARANRELLTVVQIESATAIDNIDEIAAVDGVDVLFIGPADLSMSYGIYGQFDHPVFVDAVARVKAAGRRHGKALGGLILRPDDLPRWIEDGFTFLAHGIDSLILRQGMETALHRLDPWRT